MSPGSRLTGCRRCSQLVLLGLGLLSELVRLLYLLTGTFGGFPVRLRLFAPFLFLACLLGHLLRVRMCLSLALLRQRLLHRQLMFLNVSQSHEAASSPTCAASRAAVSASRRDP